MIIMRHTRGFSLIETLIAIVIASLSVLALLQTTSNASRQSFRYLNNYDNSVLMGLMIQILPDANYDSTLTAHEVISKRYAIDNDAITEFFKQHTFTLNRPKKEELSLDATIQAGATQSLMYQQRTLKSATMTQSFFQLDATNQ